MCFNAPVAPRQNKNQTQCHCVQHPGHDVIHYALINLILYILALRQHIETSAVVAYFVLQSNIMVISIVSTVGDWISVRDRKV